MFSIETQAFALAKRLLAVLAILAILAFCGLVFPAWTQFDLQGHRGARGLMPENTLPAFAHALSLGVTTLELDVVVSADGAVVVSHDRVLNPALTRMPSGDWLKERGPALSSLTFKELETCDCRQA